MFVKVCGITNREDALAAVDAGARALGFIFYPASARAITPEQLEPFIDAISKDVWKVGVFVNESPARIQEIGSRLGLDVAQLHGAETLAEYPRGLRVWKAFRIKGADLPSMPNSAEAVLLDGPSTGNSFNWSLANDFPGKLIVAGGLDENNVREAVAAAHPWGVDVSSRLETAPGKKDHKRMKQFIEAALGL